MRVMDVMSANVLSVSPDTKVKDAIQKMIFNNVRRLVVGNDSIVTIRDLVYNWDKLDQEVGKLASRDLVFISPEADLKEACRIVTAKGVGSLLVGDGVRIQGIITERDLIRYCRVEANGNVGDIMNVDPIISSQDATLDEIVQFMKEKYKRHAVVIEESLPVGVISVRDVARPLASGRDIRKIKAKDVMTVSVYKVTPDSSIETARFLMAEKNIGYLPVVDARSLLGDVSEREILAVLSI
ncbi:MAG: CBS domain-containing protein [Candidatus Aramenus sp.]|nr:CBS domain-containing protein [Candidatus Aramenus sp.]